MSITKCKLWPNLLTIFSTKFLYVNWMGKKQKAVNIYVSVFSVSEITFDLSLWIFDFFIN